MILKNDITYDNILTISSVLNKISKTEDIKILIPTISPSYFRRRYLTTPELNTVDTNFYLKTIVILFFFSSLFTTVKVYLQM